ncbi:hypothetical protein AN641_00110 [Candidatus Epulonipiscioides gigas]|nr:hypothetical protein AN641_00110 [Epulopiscium sp. SCG-C07WGA-EpuloA2]
MKFCLKCGEEIDSEAVICPKCGVQQSNMVSTVDSGNIGWGLLGFVVPIAGLVLFLVWKNEKPKNAKKAGLGALISVLTIVALITIFVVVNFSIVW